MGTRIEEDGLKKGPWTPEEDQKLIHCIQKYGHGNWKVFPKLAGLNRCGKSCRLRWTNYLRPDIKRGAFTDEEERVIIDLHEKLGNKWSAIASYLPGRTDNEIKNLWNTRLKKKVFQNGIDPNIHMPRTHFDTLSGLSQLLSCNDTSYLTLENVVRSQADAAHLAKTLLVCNILQLLSTGPSPPLPTETFSPGLESARVMNRPQWDSSMMGLQSDFKDVSRPVFRSTMEINSCEPGESSIMYTDYAVPDLVSASPECYNRGQEPNNFISPVELRNPPTSYDALEDLMDDEEGNRYWKQLLNQATL